MNSMWALAYIHAMGIVHRNIRPKSILIDSQKRIKIGDFGIFCLNKNNLDLENKEYKENDDIYSMGKVLYELCYFKVPSDKGDTIDNKDKYSVELTNIINLMLDQKDNINITSKEIFKKILEEYSNMNTRYSSIDSVFKCLNSYDNLFKELTKIIENMLGNKPITKFYLSCLNLLRTQKNLSYYLYAIDYFKKTLETKYFNVEEGIEINPKYIITFLFEKIHNELNSGIIQKKMYDINGPYPIIVGEEMSKMNENEMKIKFLNNNQGKFNSPISKNFKAIIKRTNKCKNCQMTTYEFSNYFFAILDLAQIYKYKIGNSIDIKENLKNPIIYEKEIYCEKCLTKTKHDCEKTFYSFPNYLIIYIDRGADFKNQKKVQIKDVIELQDNEENNNSKKFKLVGIIKRKNKNGVYFSIASFNQKWYYSEGNNVSKIKSFNDKKEGDVIMLFYKDDNNNNNNMGNVVNIPISKTFPNLNNNFYNNNNNYNLSSSFSNFNNKYNNYNNFSNFN